MADFTDVINCTLEADKIARRGAFTSIMRAPTNITCATSMISAIEATSASRTCDHDVATYHSFGSSQRHKRPRLDAPNSYRLPTPCAAVAQPAASRQGIHRSRYRPVNHEDFAMKRYFNAVAVYRDEGPI
jgi:hypothetical protein